MHTFSILIEDEDGRCQPWVTSSEAEELIGGLYGTRDILLAMRCGNEACLKLRGREIDAPIEHPVEELLEPSRVATPIWVIEMSRASPPPRELDPLSPKIPSPVPVEKTSNSEWRRPGL